MKALRSWWRKWLAGFAAIFVVVVLAAEKLDFLKSDSLVAASCTRELFYAKEDELDIVLRHRDTIAAAAEQYDLPPELLAANIYNHQHDLPTLRKFTDCAGSAMGVDLSLGLAQIRISNAAGNDGVDANSLSPAQYQHYRTLLFDPVRNTDYQAKELRHLLDRANRFPGISANTIIHDPFVMALVISEYRLGRQPAASTVSRLSANAFWDLRLLLGDTVQLFGRDSADVVQIQQSVRQYLEQVYCDGKRFNERACDEWHSALQQYISDNGA